MLQEPTATVSPTPILRTGPGQPETLQQQAAEDPLGPPVRSGVLIEGSSWQWHALSLQISFRSRQPEDDRDCWEVWAFPTVKEVPSGPPEDETGGSGIDVLRFLHGFVAEHGGVNTARSSDHPELILKGKFRDKGVLLHVSLEPPIDESAGDTTRKLAVTHTPIPFTGPGQPEASQQKEGEIRPEVSVKSGATTGGSWQWHPLDLQFGFRYRKPEDEADCWEAWAFPAVQAILDGTHEGKSVNFDSEFLREFEVEHIGVNSAMSADTAELILEGKLGAKTVRLHVALEPPQDTGAAEIIDLTEPGNSPAEETN